MILNENQPLAPLTSFGVGGDAELLATLSHSNELQELSELFKDDLWVLGEGTNTLISDEGLPGLTVLIKNQGIEVKGTEVTVEAGTNWDDLVKFSIDNQLWGLELMSGIPGSVGAGIAGNIAAYGQAVSDTLKEVTVFNPHDGSTKTINGKDAQFDYRSSIFKTKDFERQVITSATFNLSKVQTKELEYESAIVIAKLESLAPDLLKDRRKIILQAREKAGSLLKKDSEKTAGSFYKNPMVSHDIAEHVLSFEEFDLNRESILKANKIHGGSGLRVSASHVMLAAGFKRGQTWGKVQLHPNHVLKLVNLGGATAQDIYKVHQEIVATVKQKLSVELEPEVKFLGKF